MLWLWLLIGIGGFVVVIGILAAVAIPAFMDYQKKAKRVEAELNLNALNKSVQRHFYETAAVPETAAGPTPGRCCDGPGHKCAVDPAVWRAEPWASLDFELTEPSAFSYSYEPLPGNTGYVLRAHADLDCDGMESVWEQRGTIVSGNIQSDELVRPARVD